MVHLLGDEDRSKKKKTIEVKTPFGRIACSAPANLPEDFFEEAPTLLDIIDQEEERKLKEVEKLKEAEEAAEVKTPEKKVAFYSERKKRRSQPFSQSCFLSNNQTSMTVMINCQ